MKNNAFENVGICPKIYFVYHTLVFVIYSGIKLCICNIHITFHICVFKDPNILSFENMVLCKGMHKAFKSFFFFAFFVHNSYQINVTEGFFFIYSLFFKVMTSYQDECWRIHAC